MANEAREKIWADGVRNQLQPTLAVLDTKDVSVKVECGRRLPYALEVDSYGTPGIESWESKARSYQTDLLIYDQSTEDSWTPRLVIECKFGGISTHDILTYCTKAATHKQIHPYLRYGILIGNHTSGLDAKVAWHGMYFDFAMVWQTEVASGNEWSNFMDIVILEIRASRKLHAVIHDKFKKLPISFFHKPLKFEKM